MRPTFFILSMDQRDLEVFRRSLKSSVDTDVLLQNGRHLRISDEGMAERIIVAVKYNEVAHDLHLDEISFDPEHSNALFACAFERGNLKDAQAALEKVLKNSLKRGDYLLTLTPSSPR